MLELFLRSSGCIDERGAHIIDWSDLAPCNQQRRAATHAETKETAALLDSKAWREAAMAIGNITDWCWRCHATKLSILLALLKQHVRVGILSQLPEDALVCGSPQCSQLLNAVLSWRRLVLSQPTA